MMSKRLMLAAAGSYILIQGLPAAAQQTPGAQFDAGGPSVEEIVVTAQRRSENRQSVPISVTAVSAAQLEQAGVTSSSDLSVIAPAVRVSTGLGGADISIRGVSGTGSGADEPANAVYIDGVYQSSPTASLFEFNNIERVEVLKGPQGTLFGRNAAGGLIQVITRPPQFSPDLKVEAGYGNYDTAQGNLYATTPLGSNVAIDIAGSIDHQNDGWGRNTATGRDAYRGDHAGARSKLLWNISSDTSLTLAALFSRTYSPSLQGGGLLPGELTVTGFMNPGYFLLNRNTDDRAGTNQQNYAATLKHEFTWATFTSITSRDDVRFHVSKDLDMSPVPVLDLRINSDAKTWTQELQLASAAGSPVTWTGGFFYYYNRLLTDPLRVTGLAVAPLQYADTYSDAVTRSYAAYGQATFAVLDRTHLTAGVRYTRDERRIDFTTQISVPDVPPTRFPTQKTTNSKPTWRLALDRQLAADVLVYVSDSRGFKSGLFNATNPGLPSAEPETVDAYEVGLKSELFDHRLRANLSAFYNDVKDIQLRGVPRGLTTPIFYNAANANFKGVDLEVEAVPVERLKAQANVAYLYGRYGAGFTNALFYSVPPAPLGGLDAGIGDASGNQPVLAPKWAASLSAQYVIPSPAGDFELAGTYSFSDSFFFDPQNRVRQPAYSLVNASITWNALAHLRVVIWGKNLSDRHYYTNIEPSNFGDEYYPAAPRTFGGTIRWTLR